MAPRINVNEIRRGGGFGIDETRAFAFGTLILITAATIRRQLAQASSE
jgi:xanthine dehydrogenase molybdopterin-binding subunit B